MMKIRVTLFILAFSIWLLLSLPVDAQGLVMGVLAGILVAIFCADLFEKKTGIFNRPLRYLWLVYYIPFFAWECFKANLDGAYRVIHPDLLLKPGIVKVKTTLKSDTGLTFLANSLTLTPGTMTVDIDKENGFLYVHWVNVLDTDIDRATELLVAKFERILKKVFA
ncbi:MAG: Na+/H+ antiporter subunit E [Candidatus Omnitrophota bacterium]